MKLYTGVGGWDKNAVALKEMKSNEEPLPGVGQAYIPLHHETCSPAMIAFPEYSMWGAMGHGY